MCTHVLRFFLLKHCEPQIKQQKAWKSEESKILWLYRHCNNIYYWLLRSIQNHSLVLIPLFFRKQNNLHVCLKNPEKWAINHKTFWQQNQSYSEIGPFNNQSQHAYLLKSTFNFRCVILLLKTIDARQLLAFPSEITLLQWFQQRSVMILLNFSAAIYSFVNNFILVKIIL